MDRFVGFEATMLALPQAVWVETLWTAPDGRKSQQVPAFVLAKPFIRSLIHEPRHRIRS